MMTALQLALLAYAAVGARGEPNEAPPNMNGDIYTLSLTPKQVPGKFPTNYRDYPGTVEYFDVYSPPITSTYAEIFWKTLPTVPLPAEIVERFAGKPMAVIGLEWDQVRRTPAGDISVPMNVAYNHHYGTNLLGADASLVRVDAGDPRVPSSGHGPALDRAGTTLVVEDRNPNSTVPNSQAFFSQNGAATSTSFGTESRAFLSFAQPYARGVVCSTACPC